MAPDQGELFEPSQRGRHFRLRWQASGGDTRAAYGKVGRRFDLLQGEQRTGVAVLHCGHPTAIRPWYLDGDGRELRTFQHLRDAQAAAVEAFNAGA